MYLNTWRENLCHAAAHHTKGDFRKHTGRKQAAAPRAAQGSFENPGLSHGCPHWEGLRWPVRGTGGRVYLLGSVFMYALYYDNSLNKMIYFYHNHLHLFYSTNVFSLPCRCELQANFETLQLIMLIDRFVTFYKVTNCQDSSVSLGWAFWIYVIPRYCKNAIIHFPFIFLKIQIFEGSIY